jgi:hypothetical protein
MIFKTENIGNTTKNFSLCWSRYWGRNKSLSGNISGGRSRGCSGVIKNKEWGNWSISRSRTFCVNRSMGK